MLEVTHVNHHYGRVQVLFGLEFAVQSGEILGFLGPNGAGKSTTMRVLTGFLTPTSGSVRFEGADVMAEPMAVRRHLGYLPERVPLYPELTVNEYLSWVARVKGADTAQVTDVAGRCGLDSARKKLVKHLSRGYQQRLGLAQAILGPTRLLILDEPTVGLDPKQIRDIRELIRDLGRDMTIILSTHILPEVELTCDRVLIIDNGRIVTEDTPARLAERATGQGRHVLTLGPAQGLTAEAAHDVLTEQAWVTGARVEARADGLDGSLRCAVDTTPGEDHRAELASLVVGRGWPLLELKAADASLEEAFVHLLREDEATETEGGAT